jgi:hypothetical protein
MITYVKVEGLIGKRPVAVRTNVETGRPEYCFGCDLWRPSIRRAWADYQRSQESRKIDVAPGVPSSLYR